MFGPIIKAFSRLSIGIFISSAIGYIISTSTGRIIGPERVGIHEIIISISQFLIIPMLLGINTAIVHFVSISKSTVEEKSIVDSGITLISVQTIVVLLLYVLFMKRLISFFNLDRDKIYVSILYSLILAYNILGKSYYQSKQEFQTISLLEITNSILRLLTYLVMIIFAIRSYMLYTFPLIVGMLLFAFMSFHNCKFNFNSYNTIKIVNLYKFGLLATLGGFFGAILGNIDRIMISKYLSYNDVGIYSAYFFSGNFAVGKVINILITVIFPIFSRNQKTFHRNAVIKAVLCIFLISMVLSLITIPVSLLIYGNKYPLNWNYVLLFSLSVSLIASYQILMWIVNSRGISGVRNTIIGLALSSFTNATLNLILIKIYGLYGAIIATMISAILLVFYFLLVLEKYAK